MHKNLQSISKKSNGRFKKNTALPVDNLRHLAFDNAVQANIITTANTGKIITVNSAACKLFGYSKKELVTKNRTDIFDIRESGFKKLLKQRTEEGKSVGFVTAIKKSAKKFTCEITSAVFTDEYGIKKAITTVADISPRILLQKEIDSKKEKLVADNIILAKSAQKKIDIKKEKSIADNIIIAKAKQKTIDTEQAKKVAGNIILARAKSDARIVENNKWIKHIAKTSYDVMWDWDTATNEIYAGDSIEEVFGYKVQNNTVSFSDFLHCLLPGEKNIVEKKLFKTLTSSKNNWSDSYMLRRKDGSIAEVTSRASIVRDEKGKAVRLIGATQDISRLQQLEKKLKDEIIIQEEQRKNFLLAAKLSFDVIWDWDLKTNEVFLGDGFEELFGYVIKDNKGNMITDWVNYLHPDDKDAITKELRNAIASAATHWEHAYRVTRADGSIAKVYVRASIIRYADGKAYRMIGAMQDLSRQKVLEEKLELEIKLKELQIAEAAEDAKETERSDIGKELHDNINQLLGASKMYVEMAKRGGANSQMYLNRSTEYTLSAIEEIRKLSKGLITDIIKNMGLAEAIEKLAADMMEVNPVKIYCALKKFTENSVSNKFKLNILRIVQEQLNNILKHAKAKEIWISIAKKQKTIELIIVDNGIGFNTAVKQNGIGIENIKSRAVSYNGNASFVSQTGKGCVLTVTIPADV
ncbi:PAS domain-containing sensor histidine kinase [Ferruginibacter sp.]